MIRRVVKVGGSLLKRRNLANELIQWTNRQPSAQNLFVFGGGDTVNTIRELDEIHSLDAKMAHWMCVNLLDVSFAIAESWFGEWQTIETKQAFTELVSKQPCESNCIVRCTSFYHADQAENLPQDWRTTSDSIAAKLAALSNAEELILLKTCSVEDQQSHQSLADLGIVDAAFPNAAKSISHVRVESLVQRSSNSTSG